MFFYFVKILVLINYDYYLFIQKTYLIFGFLAMYFNKKVNLFSIDLNIIKLLYFYYYIIFASLLSLYISFYIYYLVKKNALF